MPKEAIKWGYGRVIRFCDSDVGCVQYDTLNRSELLSYFLSGHLDEIVCVYEYDNCGTKGFAGIITYYSLLYAISLDGAILKDHVILDQDIWQNAREIFKKMGHNNTLNTFPIPVFSKDYQLICFAYQDEDANREIRMLRELKETPGVLQFLDVFPRYTCVKIHEFNELAYFFAIYLREQKIPVQVDGAMWQDFFSGDICQVPDYECLQIYAEGTWEKKCNWKENLLRSVSAEFECIDVVYETNIKNNFISDTAGKGCNELLDCLREEQEIILCGTDMRAQDTYDFLQSNGIAVSCFVVDEVGIGNMHRLFGKKILGFNEVVYFYQNPVFIDCTSRYSAWGLGKVDYYDYFGYKRNERFVVLRDYIEIPASNLLNAIKDTDVILTGDRYLCGRLYEYLLQNGISVIGFICMLSEDLQPPNIPEVPENKISEEAICLIVEPIYKSDTKKGFVGEEEKKQRIAYLRRKNINNFTDYFCDINSFIHIEKNNNVKYKNLKPKRVVLGSIVGYNGNLFFRSLLDAHPFILSIHYCDLNYQLFWICVRLSMECAENILPLFWKLIEGNEKSIFNKQVFVKKMEQLLADGIRFSS